MGYAERVDPERSLILPPTRTEAIEAMNAQTDKPTLKTLKSVLLDVVQKVTV